MRRVLKFRPEFLDLVLAGVKTTTVRIRDGVEYADDLVLTDGKRRVDAKLVKVERLMLREAVAHFASEGFRSPQEFLQTLKKIYPFVRFDDMVTVIHFRLNTPSL